MSMSQNVIEKGVLGSCVAVFAYLQSNITITVIILAILMIFDYVTGLIAAIMNKEYDKEKGVNGLIKKICYAFLVAAAFLTDLFIKSLTESVGYVIPLQAMFGIVAIVYLCGNELWSIAGNLIRIGVPVPPQFLAAFGLIKDTAGKVSVLKDETEQRKDA